MSDYRPKRHHVSALLYHIVCPATSRRGIVAAEVDTVLTEVGLDRAKRYAIAFGAIGTDKEQVPFLGRSVPSYRPTKIVKRITSLTARAILPRVPAVKKRLWGGALWSKGACVSTVGRHGNAHVMRQYVKKQGSEKVYKQLQRQDMQ